jgi:hypothetical protein
VRGILEGIVFCKLQDGRQLVAEVQKGIFHGPVMLHAVIQILPVNNSSLETFCTIYPSTITFNKMMNIILTLEVLT